MFNQLKTVILLGLLTALLLWIGRFFGPSGLTFAFIFVIIMNVGSYWFSDKIVLKMYKAKEVEHNHKLYKIVHEVAQLARIPTPKAYILPTNNLNAFATGRDPSHSAVAATHGIIEHLTDEELKGVIAHEIAHIRNRDTLISTIAATVAGVIGYVAMMARWGAIFGGFGRDNDSGSNIIELIVLAVVTPLMATVIQMAISRSREFAADETGAKIIRNPHALASALLKLEKGAKHHPLKEATQATAHMFIINPFNSKIFKNFFSTHPPAEERIKRLKAIL